LTGARGDVLGMVTELAARGMFVFPVDHPLLPVCAGAHRECSGDRGKHPACQWSRASTTRAAMVRGRAPGNIGIDCGKSGLLVLDEDAAGELNRLCAERGHVRRKKMSEARQTSSREFYYRSRCTTSYNSAASTTTR